MSLGMALRFSMVGSTRRRMHTSLRCPNTTTSFRNLYPQPTWSTRLFIRKNGTPRSWKKGVLFATLSGAAVLLTWSVLEIQQNLQGYLNSVASALYIVLLDSASYNSVFDPESTDSWESPSDTWSLESYKMVLNYFRSLAICNNPTDTFNNGEYDYDTATVQDNTRFVEVMDVIVQAAWKIETTLGDEHQDSKLLARKIVKEACTTSHDFIQAYEGQVAGWLKREEHSTLNIFAGDTLRHLFPPATKDNTRRSAVELAAVLNLIMLQHIVALVNLAKRKLPDNDLDQLVKELHDIKHNASEYEELGRE